MMNPQPAHTPYLKEIPGSNTMILFIHGFMGSPDQFHALIAASVRAGYSVSSMLLPGHGGTGQDFANSSRFRWEEAVREHILTMCKKYPNIILVGHSMGTLLSFSLYNEFRESIKGIVAIATPLSLKFRLSGIKVGIQTVFGKVNDTDLLSKACVEFNSVKRSSILTYVIGVPRYFDLFYLMLSTRKRLKQVDVPCLAIHAVNDEVANIKSTDTLKKRLRHVEMLPLLQSGHYYYSEQDTKLILDTFLRFLATLGLSSQGNVIT